MPKTRLRYSDSVYGSVDGIFHGQMLLITFHRQDQNWWLISWNIWNTTIIIIIIIISQLDRANLLFYLLFDWLWCNYDADFLKKNINLQSAVVECMISIWQMLNDLLSNQLFASLCFEPDEERRAVSMVTDKGHCALQSSMLWRHLLSASF